MWTPQAVCAVMLTSALSFVIAAVAVRGMMGYNADPDETDAVRVILGMIIGALAGYITGSKRHCKCDD